MIAKAYVTADEVKQAVEPRGWRDVLRADLPADLIDNGEAPCPVCKGTDRCYIFDDFDKTGAVNCRKCRDDKSTGDGIGTIAWLNGVSMGKAIALLAERLGLKPSVKPEQDIIAEVCKDKRMPTEAFMQFQPEVVKRGQHRQLAVRIPVYNERGEAHSYFDFVPGQKGYLARGKGMSGLFFPGKLPQPGETWLLPEGAKDASALIGLGYLSAGLPSSSMPSKYAQLFKGVHVILVPDLDEVGQNGAQKSGSRLFGIAASVKVARLPGELTATNGQDVRDILKKPDGEKLVRDAVNDAKAWEPREGEDTGKDGKPEVIVSLNYGSVVDQVIKHLGRLGWDSPWIAAFKRERLKLYQRAGILTQVIVEPAAVTTQAGIKLPAGAVRIRPLPVGQLPLRITDACRLMVEKEVEGEIELVPTQPANWLINGIFTHGDFGNEIKALDGVITAPTIRPDGTILQTEGWDSKTGLLYYASEKFPKVPENPTHEDAKQAAGLLLSVVKDFPFQEDADRSAWIAHLLSIIGRPAITGCVPLFAFTATCPGSGKTLCVEGSTIIATGRSAARKPFTSEDAEQRKAITAIALEALPTVLLDNIEGTLRGSSLDAALTGLTWKDRILGKSENTTDLPLRTVWAATGNNLRFGSDIARRVLPIRLVPDVENPEERTGFDHPNLMQWVTDNRPQLAVAALTMLRAYFVAGKPAQPGGQWGSFESWSEIVRGAIVWCGLADPLATRETAKADDNSISIVRSIVGGLLEIDEDGSGLTAREIAAALNDTANVNRFPTMREVVAEIATTKGIIDSSKLGYALRKYKGRIANGFRLVGTPSHGGVAKWSACRVSGGDGCNGGDSFNAREAKPVHLHDSEIDTCEIHKGAHGNAPGQSQPSPSSPPQTAACSSCGQEMTWAPAGPGLIEWECSRCGFIYQHEVEHEPTRF